MVFTRILQIALKLLAVTLWYFSLNRKIKYQENTRKPMIPSKMETICVDGEYYDPYFILGVTQDDSLEQIKSAFKKRAKKYHPDKAFSKSDLAKYELRFKIVVASYEYIKNKRNEQVIREKHHQAGIKTTFDKETLEQFNEEFLKEATSPMSFGYGDQKRIENEKDYQEFQNNLRIINQFAGKEFTTDEFNRLFEYLKAKKTNESEDKQTRSLVHKTTDGFYGFNTGEVGDFAQVSSYNGLMVTGDNFGQSGVGYWSNNYGDYRLSYSEVKNPEDVVQVPEKFKRQTSKKPSRKQLSNRIQEYQSKDASVVLAGGQGYREVNEQFYQKTLNDLMTKQEQDKQMIIQYAKQNYPAETLQQAMAGQLEQSPSLLLALQEHYNCKKINN